MDSRLHLPELRAQLEAEDFLFKLIERQDTYYLKRLIENGEPKPRLNIRNNDGETPVIKAIKLNFNEALKILMEAKADLTLTDRSNWTPLHWATYNACLVPLQTLLDAQVPIPSGILSFVRDDGSSLKILQTAIAERKALEEKLKGPPADKAPKEKLADPTPSATTAQKKPGLFGSWFKSKPCESQQPLLEGYQALPGEEKKLGPHAH